jgi:hypothetical protein
MHSLQETALLRHLLSFYHHCGSVTASPCHTQEPCACLKSLSPCFYLLFYFFIFYFLFFYLTYLSYPHILGRMVVLIQEYSIAMEYHFRRMTLLPLIVNVGVLHCVRIEYTRYQQIHRRNSLQRAPVEHMFESCLVLLRDLGILAYTVHC